MIKSIQNKSYRKEIDNLFTDNKISLEFKTFNDDNNLISDNNFNFKYLNKKDKNYYNQNNKFEYTNNNKNNIIKDIKFKNNLNFQLEQNYYFNSNKLDKKYVNNFYNNDIRLNTLNINENINLTPFYNIEDRNIPLNTNKSFEFIMPPNDLTDIYKKNLIFHQLINQE